MGLWRCHICYYASQIEVLLFWDALEINFFGAMYPEMQFYSFGMHKSRYFYKNPNISELKMHPREAFPWFGMHSLAKLCIPNKTLLILGCMRSKKYASHLRLLVIWDA